MKQKKSESKLSLELSKIQQLSPQQMKLAEKKMNSLIQKALSIYKDELDPNLAQVQQIIFIFQFYFEYGNILLQILEERDDENFTESKTDKKAQLIKIKDDNQLNNDKELRDAQVAWENLEISHSIIQTQINIIQGEYDELQQKMIKLSEQKTRWQTFLSKSQKRIGDLYSWREDYQDALETYEQLLDQVPRNNVKEIAELHYKIGNVQLQQALPGCEKKALKNLQTSFQICIEAQKMDLGYYDLNSVKSIQVIKDKLLDLQQTEQIILLILLLEKIEDTISQLKETIECNQEIEKWKQNNFQLNEDFNKQKKAIFDIAQQKPATSKKFEQSEKISQNQIINLGVYGSASRQPKQQLASFDNITKQLKQ